MGVIKKFLGEVPIPPTPLIHLCVLLTPNGIDTKFKKLFQRVSSTEGQSNSSQSRIDSTRVDADELINNLIKDHDLQSIEVDQLPVERHSNVNF